MDMKCLRKYLFLLQESLNSVDDKKKGIDDNELGTTNILADRRNKLETAAQVSVNTILLESLVFKCMYLDIQKSLKAYRNENKKQIISLK